MFDMLYKIGLTVLKYFFKKEPWVLENEDDLLVRFWLFRLLSSQNSKRLKLLNNIVHTLQVLASNVTSIPR